MSRENYAKCEFSVYVSTDATADAASCSTFAAFILIPKDSKPKIWMHINNCLSSVNAIPIQEVQKVFCVDDSRTTRPMDNSARGHLGP